MSDTQACGTGNQEVIKIFLINFLFPIILGILAFIASNTVNSWRSRKRQSLLGAVKLQSFIEEVENGIQIMESVRARLNDPASQATIGPLPRRSWDGMRSVSDEILERIICTSKNKRFSGFPPKEILIRLKNYFEHMCTNFDSVINAMTNRANWEDVARAFLERGRYIDAANGVLQMLKDAQQLLDKNSKALCPK